MAPLTAHDAGPAGDHGAAGAPLPASTPSDMGTDEQTLATAEELLTRRSGAQVRLADPEDLGGSARSRVVRVRVAENPFSLPRTLVLKHYPVAAGPAGDDADAPDPFCFEAASCQLFTALHSEERASPLLVANDPQARLLVLEDLGRCATLADKMHGDDAKAAERALLGAARALGRVQAVTAGREGDFGALLRRFGVRTWRDPMADEARAALAEVPDQLAHLLRVEAAPAAVSEARAAARLLGGTGYRAFSPAEVGPDNCLLTGSGVRFLDFEWGCFRDVALTVASLRLPFPGSACEHALPAGMVEAMTASWQSEVATVWEELDDPAVAGPRVMQAELLWVWMCTWALLPGVTGHAAAVPRTMIADPGSTAAARLSGYWARLGTDARAFGSAVTAELADSVQAALVAHGGSVPLPVYPAFG